MLNIFKISIVLLIMTYENIALADDITTTTATTSTERTISAPDESTTTSTTTTKVDTTNHDQEIAVAISNKFANDTVLIGTSLTATCENGIVTLSGTVTMQSQADQAVSLAQSTPGVTSVNSQITVATNPRSPQ